MRSDTPYRGEIAELPPVAGTYKRITGKMSTNHFSIIIV